MDVMFRKCSDAINHTLATKSYGIFYSTEGIAESNIHVHECCEILFCLSGGNSFLIDNNIYEVVNGDVFIINQFEPHKITFNENETFERYVIQIHPSFIYGNSTDNTDLSLCFYTRNESISNKITLSEVEIKYLNTLLEKTDRMYSFGDDIVKNNAITEILTFINTKFIEASKNKFPSATKSNKIIRETINYINQHYSEDIHLPDLAANSYISVNHLCNLFKKSLGTTILKYINSKRISEAKKLLKSGKSVSETAELCGFNDYANFIRSFKNIVGVSPGKYSEK